MGHTLSLGGRDVRWRGGQTGQMWRTGGKGLQEQQCEASLGTKTPASREHRCVTLSGQVSKTGTLACCCRSGPGTAEKPLSARAAGSSRRCSRSLLLQGMEWAVSWMLHLLHRCTYAPQNKSSSSCPDASLQTDDTVRSTSLAVPAGLLNCILEGRVQAVINWLTQANTLHRGRNSLEPRRQVWKRSGQALLREPAASGRTAETAAGKQQTARGGHSLRDFPLLPSQPSHKGTTRFTCTKNIRAKTRRE